MARLKNFVPKPVETLQGFKLLAQVFGRVRLPAYIEGVQVFSLEVVQQRTDRRRVINCSNDSTEVSGVLLFGVRNSQEHKPTVVQLDVAEVAVITGREKAVDGPNSAWGLKLLLNLQHRLSDDGLQAVHRSPVPREQCLIHADDEVAFKTSVKTAGDLLNVGRLQCSSGPDCTQQAEIHPLSSPLPAKQRNHDPWFFLGPLDHVSHEPYEVVKGQFIARADDVTQKISKKYPTTRSCHWRRVYPKIQS